jgi:hypothetical protein
MCDSSPPDRWRDDSGGYYISGPSFPTALCGRSLSLAAAAAERALMSCRRMFLRGPGVWSAQGYCCSERETLGGMVCGGVMQW